MSAHTTVRRAGFRDQRVSLPGPGRRPTRERLLPELRGSVALGAGSAASFFVGLAMVPLTIGYLGSARFGAWMTIAAAAALLEPLDLGLGSALVTLLAKASGSGDPSQGARFFRAAVMWSSLAGVLLLALVILAVPRVQWTDVFNIDGAVASEATPLVLVFGCAIAIGLPLTVIDRALIGLRHPGWLGIRMLTGHVLSLVLVAFGATMHASVVVLAALALSGPLLTQMVSAALVAHRMPWLICRHATDDASLQTLLRSGALFLLLQLASAVAFTSDQIVIARVLDAESVSEYAVPARLFAITAAVAVIAVRPLWPAYAKASATGDMAWIRSTLRKSVVGVSLISTMLALVAVVGRGPLLRALGRGEVSVSFWTIVAFAMWGVLSSIGTAVAMFLNGLGIVKFQVIVGSVMAITNLLLSVWLAGVVGVAGVVWGSVLAYSATVLAPFCWFLHRWNRSIA